MMILTLKRLTSMILIMLVVSFILFALFETDKLDVAGKVLGPYSSVEQREIWLEKNGYNEPFLKRYVVWVGNAIRGDFGQSIQLKVPVSEVLGQRLANTGILALCLFAVMIPISLTMGIFAGMKEGSYRDRVISVTSGTWKSSLESRILAFRAVSSVKTSGTRSSSKIASQGHSGSHTPQSMHSSGSM